MNWMSSSAAGLFAGADGLQEPALLAGVGAGGWGEADCFSLEGETGEVMTVRICSSGTTLSGHG